ncbi:tetratricopeptide repeat-containing diguanylate cyclase [Thiolapillus sp.]
MKNDTQIEIQELEEELQHLSDNSAEYIDARNRLSRLLFRTRPRQAVSLCEQSIEIAKSIDYLPGLATAYGVLSHSQISLSQYAEAREAANKAIQLFVHLDDPEGLLDANNALGISYNTSGEYEKALELFLRNEELARAQGDTEMQGKSLNNVACILLDQGNYSGALEYYIRTFECTRELKQPEMKGTALLNIGVTHLELENLEEALSYLTRSMEYISHVPEIKARALQNLSHYFQKVGDHEQSLLYGEQCLTGYQVINNTHGIIGALSNLGEIHLEQEHLDKAEIYFEQALKICAQKKEKTEQARNHLLLGRVYIRKQQADKAIQTLQKVFALKKNYKTCTYEAHQELSRLFEHKGDYKSALFHHREYVRIKDRLFNQQSEQQIQSLRISFELEQAEREARLLKQKNEELAQNNKKLEQLTRHQKALDTQKSRLVAQLENYAHKDSLTDLFNRRYLDQNFQIELDQALSNDSPLCVMICDIDDFKQVNDRYSHKIGDAVLVEVSRIIAAHIREYDILSRYGGEEFVLLMPGTEETDAIHISQRLNELIEHHDWDTIQPGMKITISIGLCCDTSVSNHEKMLACADQYLYQAKHQGKNQLCYCRQGKGFEQTERKGPGEKQF